METLSKYTYLLTMVLSILGPIFLSFERSVKYVRYWKKALIASIIVGIPFVIWDIIFTNFGVWGFNEKYVTGTWIARLPIEEWSFFIVVPFCCLFIYQILVTKIQADIDKYSINVCNVAIGSFFLIFSALNFDKKYTFVSFGILGISLLIATFFKKKNWRNFWLAFIIQLLPMAVVNGILTACPVVWYNNSENLGIRLGTIPVEDFSYGLINFIWVVIVYEKLGETEFWQKGQKITE